MTTAQAAKLYEAQHLSEWGDRGYAIYNPNDAKIEDLPTIWGFNNGGIPGWFSGQLLAEDGTSLGGHICSSEGYMPHDLGVLKSSRPERHETFRAHYPDGYKMHFVGYDDVPATEGLMAAIERANALDADEDQ